MQPQHAATLTQPLQCDLQRLSCKTQDISTRNGVGNCSSKIGSRRHSEKKTILKHFLKGFLEGKSLAPKWRKFANKSMSQPSCSDSNTIYEIQLQKTIVLRMQPQHAATLTQPLQCDLQRLSCKTQDISTRNGVGNCSSKIGSRRHSEKKTILKHFLKGFLEGKSLAPKWRKFANKSMSQPSCSHSNTIYEIQLQKTIVLRMQPQHAATLTQPLQCDLQRLSCKTQDISTRNGVGNCSSKIGSRRHSEKKTILKHFLKGFLEGKSLAPKWRKFANKSMSQPSCSDSNTIYEVELQKTIVLRMQPQHEATLTQPLQCDLQRLSSKTQ